MKKLALLFVCIFTVQLSVFADNDRPITFEQLPLAAQQFITSNFSGKKIMLVKIESGIVEKNYDVVFENGDVLEFDRKGRWTDIECKRNEVPASVTPAKIADYVKTNHKGAKILKIEKDDKNFDVTLSNGWELTFNKKFNVIDIDR